MKHARAQRDIIPLTIPPRIVRLALADGRGGLPIIHFEGATDAGFVAVVDVGDALVETVGRPGCAGQEDELDFDEEGVFAREGIRDAVAGCEARGGDFGVGG